MSKKYSLFSHFLELKNYLVYMSKNNNKQRELLIFVPSIEDGGVEKNLF